MSSQVPFAPLPGSNGQPTATVRHGDTVLRPAGLWTPAVHALLRHLEQGGFPASPRVVGDGYDQGREVLTYIEGRIAHPHAYTDEQIWQVGQLLRALHDATAGFRPPPEALWQQPWSLRSRAPDAVISHCDAGPWHVIVRECRPVGLIDWSMAGPTDRLEELAATGWWNAQLGFGDDLDPGSDSPDAAARRGTRLRSFLDGYGLPTTDRAGLVTRMVEFAVRDCAGLAEVKRITPDSDDPTTLWTLAWQTRAAAWMLRHRPILERSITG
jgi:hypothetical protein